MSEDINQRINRLIGQIEGIRRMIEKKRDCAEIAQQILAAREALSKIGLIIMKEGVCKISPRDKKKVGRLMERVFRI
jgi:DNA-binding FrmR family transcriptional regulator